MKKIKEFFTRILNAISSFFSFLGRKISDFFRFLDETVVVKKIKFILGYIPSKISSHLTNKTRKTIWGIIFLIPLCIGFIYFFLMPFIYTIIYSLSYVENGGIWEFIGIDNYVYAFKYATAKNANYEVMTFGEWVVEAVLNILADIPIILIFAMIMAVVLNSNFKGRALCRAIFFIPVIFNSQAIDTAVSAYSTLANTTANATNDLFSQMFSFKDFMLNAKVPPTLVGFLTDASTKIYDIVTYSGIQILIFLSAIQSVPRHLYEAAKMEGATQYEMFWKITFPMVSPMLMAAAVYTVVDSFLRSPILKILNIYSGSTKVFDFGSETLGKFIEADNMYKLTNYGINAAMSVVFTGIIGIILALILGVLSKVVFYYDE